MRELPQETLTVRELQQILKIGANSAYTLIHSKAFPVIKIGQTCRIPAEPFYVWLGKRCLKAKKIENPFRAGYNGSGS